MKEQKRIFYLLFLLICVSLFCFSLSPFVVSNFVFSFYFCLPPINSYFYLVGFLWVFRCFVLFDFVFFFSAALPFASCMSHEPAEKKNQERKIDSLLFLFLFLFCFGLVWVCFLFLVCFFLIAVDDCSTCQATRKPRNDIEQLDPRRSFSSVDATYGRCPEHGIIDAFPVCFLFFSLIVLILSLKKKKK